MAKGEGAERGKSAGPSAAGRDDDKVVNGVSCVGAIPCGTGAAAGKAMAAAGPTINGDSSVIAGVSGASGIPPADGIAGRDDNGIPNCGRRVSKVGVRSPASGL